MELVFLTQPNCAGCKKLKRKLKNEDVDFVTVDVAEDVGAKSHYTIQSTPVLILCDDGEEVSRIIGYDPATQEDDVDEFIAQLD